MPDRVESFAKSARRFCEFADDAAQFAEPVRATTAFALLAELVALAASIPTVEPATTDERTWQTKALPRTWPGFGRQHYREIFNAFDVDDEVVGDLDDDMRDILGDVSEGLAMFDAGQVALAAEHWRFTFLIHWGEHATSALRALYWIVRQAE